MASAWSEIKALHKQSTFGAKEGVAFRYFSRPLASFILYFIRNSKITPNQVTILSLIVGVAGTVFQVFDLTYRGLLIGGFLFMMAHMLDALDGQLARHRKAGSVIGMYFDFFIDELKAYFIFISVAFRLYLQAQQGIEPWLLKPLLACCGEASILYLGVIGLAGLSIGISCTQFVKNEEWAKAFPPGPGSDAKPTGIKAVIAMVEKGGKFVIDYPSYILLLCVVNMVEVYFIVYALAVCLYSLRALFGISLALWRVNPYANQDAEA